MPVKTVQLLQDAIALAKTGQIDEAATALRGVVTGNVETDVDEGELFDLLMETYLFLMGGDLRKEGRDFGYASIEDIESELNRLLAQNPS